MKTSLRLEMLEQRRVLAGNVVADFDGGKLELIGDNQANEIDVNLDGTDIVVQGLGDTTVNGSSDPVVYQRNGDIDLVAKMEKGDDSIHISGTIEGDADIETNEGNDFVGLGPLTVGGDLKIETHQGADNIDVTDPLSVSGDTTIKTDQGNDVVRMFFADLIFGEDLTIETGNGDDGIFLMAGPLGQLNFAVGGDFEIKSGKGNDEVGLFASNFFFGPGPALVSVGGDLKVDLGDGNDTFETESTSVFGDFSIEGDLEIKGGNGNDLVTLATNFGSIFVGGDLKLDGGSGNDGPAGATVLGSVIVDGDTEVKDFESGV